MCASLLGKGSRIEVGVASEPLSIEPDRAATVGHIVNELATNAVKYAFPGRSGGIVLGFGRRDGEVVLTVSDNGVGLGNAGGPAGSGLGSRFVDAFVRQVGGTLATVTGPYGTAFTVRPPASILSEARGAGGMDLA
ncbi:sensor histidine kinase [Methylobacterium dankookense]|uniref:sensor histidine kinase n=1 Tax=Methylobacterium dankookense TaxID=560405 RepID=UPI001FCFABDB|nr:sensor histidine kinase [Methylobacterium dankookense]